MSAPRQDSAWHSATSRWVLAALGLVLACRREFPPQPLAPVEQPSEAPSLPESVEPDAPSLPPIIDLCVHEAGDRLCVLHEDGRVSCAYIDDPRFQPPLDGVADVVELACGSHSICMRTDWGRVSCIGDAGELTPMLSVENARSLADDCAVTQRGSLECWDAALVSKKRHIPRPSGPDAYYARNGSGDIVQAATTPDATQCVLRSDGQIWCWSYYGDPWLVTALDNPTEVEDLHQHQGDVCWRDTKGWTCTDSFGEARHELGDCTKQPCSTEFGLGSRPLPAVGGQVHPAKLTVFEVVLRDGPCLLDARGRVLCQRREYEPPEQLALPWTEATTERFGYAPRKLAALELPDPNDHACPAAMRVANRVCTKLAEPEGPLACQASEARCTRACRPNPYAPDDPRCAGEGFVLVGSHYMNTEYLVYAEGDRVWMQPEPFEDGEGFGDFDELPLSLAPDRLTSTVELSHRWENSWPGGEESFDLEATITCGFVDGRPACSRPIPSYWFHDLDEWDEHGANTDSQEYEATLEFDAASVRVQVQAGKRYAGSEAWYLEELGSSTKSGTYAAKQVLSQVMIEVP